MARLPLDQGIPRFKANEERIDIMTNGDENAEWTTSDGQVVPSVRKMLKDINTEGEGWLTQAGSEADRAEAAAGVAEDARDDAQDAQGLVEAARDQTLAYVQSGYDAVYATKALADAGLAGLAEGNVVLVLADETQGGRTVVYTKTGGGYVLRRYWPASKTVFVNSLVGSDANSGLLADAPVKTLASAIALLSSGDTLAVERGSIFYANESLETTNVDYIRVVPYGFGPDPIFDGTQSIATSGWTNTTGEIWEKTVTHAKPIKNAASLTADITHFGLWEVWPDVKGSKNDIELMPVWDRGSIAANYGALTRGQFTCHFNGSTGADPRTDTAGKSQSVTYYVRLTDGGDPNAGGTTLYYAEQKKWSVPASWTFENVEFRRTAAKDLAGGPGGNVLRDVKLSECAIHGWVGPHMAYGDCYATARDKPGFSDGNPAVKGNGGGGAFHQFRNDTSGILKHGVIEARLHADGFSHAVYSHGDAAGDGQYDRLRYRYIEARNCLRAIYTGDHPPSNDPVAFRPTIFDHIEAINCSSIGITGGGDEIKRVRWIGPEGAVAVRGMIDATGDVTVENGQFIFRNDRGQERGLVRNVKAAQVGNPSLVIAATFRNCSNYRGGTCVKANNWQNVDYILENSIVGDLLPTDYPARPPHSITTVGKNALAYGVQTVEEIAATFAGVSTSDTLVPWVEQTAEFTITLGDLTFRNTARTAGGTSGNSYITMNLIGGAERFVVGQTIKVLDYDGTGGEFVSEITAIGSPGANDLTLADTLDQTFRVKAVHNGFHAETIFGSAHETTGTLNDAGTILTLADPRGYATGTWFHLDNIKRRAAFGPRKAVILAGSAATLDTAAAWKLGNTTALNGGLPRPSLATRFGYPIGGGSVALAIAKVHGADVAVAEVSDGFARLNSSAYQWNSAYSSTTGQIRYELGEIDAAIPAGVGDVLTWTANVYIEDLAPQWAADPIASGILALAAGRVSDLGIG